MKLEDLVDVCCRIWIVFMALTTLAAISGLAVIFWRHILTGN